MLRFMTFLSLAAASVVANAQAPGSAPQASSDQTQPPAPIVRSYPLRRPVHRTDRVTDSQPVPGVWLRSAPASDLKTISASAQRTEIRLDRGRLNVTIHQPAQHSEILVDLPGGQASPLQVSLLKDGLYTFNADRGTVRVLRGEAAIVGPAGTDTKPIKIKEDHQLSLVRMADGKPGELKSVESYPYELTADLLPLGGSEDRAYADGYEPDYPRYGYPYYAGAWGYPYAYPGFYPGYYGYGYPFSYGIGFGYYGGYGYRGGFRR
jgi:hypothetical protein